MMDLFAVFFMAVGVLFMLLASVGLLRMPDTYLRVHAASLAPTFGKIGVLIAMAFAFHDASTIIKAALTLFFLFLTAPLATHLMMRAAYRDKSPMSDLTKTDDYASFDGIGNAAPKN